MVSSTNKTDRHDLTEIVNNTYNTYFLVAFFGFFFLPSDDEPAVFCMIGLGASYQSKWAGGGVYVGKTEIIIQFICI